MAGSSDRWILLIALFKLIKALLLIVAGIGLLKLLHRDAASVLTHWIEALRVDPDNRFIHTLLSRSLSLDTAKLKELSIGTFCYAGVFLTEGTGLILRKRWAEYFTVGVTASFLPLEVYEMFRHASVTKAAVILLNIVIMIYLVYRLRRHRVS